MDLLQAMAIFRRVAESTSFSAVAREQGLSQPTVSKQVAFLEERLDTKLLSRSTRQLKLTDAGRAYYERCVNILDDLAETEAAARRERSQPTGTLRVSMPVSFGRLHIMPRLWRFMARYPQLDVDLIMDDHYVDLVREGVDLAIRIGPLEDSGLVAQRICHSPRVTVASPAYLEQHGVPDSPADLRHHQCVVYKLLTTGNEWHFDGPNGPTKVRVNGRFSANNPDAVREAALAGMGITVPPLWLLGDAIERGDLQAVMTDYRPIPLEINALWPGRRFVPSRVRCFVDFLREEMANTELG